MNTLLGVPLFGTFLGIPLLCAEALLSVWDQDQEQDEIKIKFRCGTKIKIKIEMRAWRFPGGSPSFRAEVVAHFYLIQSFIKFILRKTIPTQDRELILHISSDKG